MRVPRFYSPETLRPDSAMDLPRDIYHHAIRVLRLQSGDSLILFDGSGQEFTAELGTINRHSARVRLDGGRHQDRESPLSITLWQGISRGERMDYALQKAVELGVQRIVPVYTERSQTRRQGDRRLNHWQGIIIAACEQCGRATLTELLPPQALAGCLADKPPGSPLLLDPAATLGLNRLAPPTDHRLTLLIGPEGGLSDAEIDGARQAGFTGIRLGPRVLRTETATAAALAAIQALWGDLG